MIPPPPQFLPLPKLSSKIQVLVSFRFLWISICGHMGQLSSLDGYLDFFFFLLIIFKSAFLFWSGLGDLFVSQNSRDFYASHCPGWILVCAFSFCLSFFFFLFSFCWAFFFFLFFFFFFKFEYLLLFWTSVNFICYFFLIPVTILFSLSRSLSLSLPAVRVFASGPGDLGSIPGRVIPKTLKMELDTTLLNTQHYKVRFKGKVEQSWEWSSALPYTLV